MQMQMPENPATSMPTPIIASPIASKPREHTEAKLDEDGKTLQPQISLEAAKVQRLGASMGTKLRPESAQKIQVCIAKLAQRTVHPLLASQAFGAGQKGLIAREGADF